MHLLLYGAFDGYEINFGLISGFDMILHLVSLNKNEFFV